jgi:hypothetical protein
MLAIKPNYSMHSAPLPIYVLGVVNRLKVQSRCEATQGLDT